jgi:hypothetical protein
MPQTLSIIATVALQAMAGLPEPEAEVPTSAAPSPALRIIPGSTAQALGYRITANHCEFEITHSMNQEPLPANVTFQISHGRRRIAPTVSHEILLGQDVVLRGETPRDGQGLAHIDTIVEADWWSLPVQINVVNTVSVRADGVEISGYISVKGKGKGSDSA